LARARLGLVETWAMVDPANAASCRVLEKLGFARPGGGPDRFRTSGIELACVSVGLAAAAS
jgi:RimJ/RimL family protein N-acetyltransferase